MRPHVIMITLCFLLPVFPVMGRENEDDLDWLEAEYTETEITLADPLEPINCVMFHLNDAVYTLAFKPVSRAYTNLTTPPMRIGIRNFFQNLSTPIRLTNCLLQGKQEGADIEFRRFLINSTAGCLGMGDPARQTYGLEPVNEDLGQTLAVYGIENGIYLVLPLLGPSTLRDAAGRMGDAFLNPVSYLEPTEAYIGVSALRFTNAHALHGDEYDTVKADAIDPYTAMRSAYLQYRRYQIEQ